MNSFVGAYHGLVPSFDSFAVAFLVPVPSFDSFADSSEKAFLGPLADSFVGAFLALVLPFGSFADSSAGAFLVLAFDSYCIGSSAGASFVDLSAGAFLVLDPALNSFVDSSAEACLDSFVHSSVASHYPVHDFGSFGGAFLDTAAFLDPASSFDSFVDPFDSACLDSSVGSLDGAFLEQPFAGLANFGHSLVLVEKRQDLEDRHCL